MRTLIKLVMVFLIPAALMAQNFIDVDGGRMTYTMIFEEEAQIRRIRVKDFRIASTEATVGEWREFTDATGFDFSWEDHYCGDLSVLSPGEDCPIQLVRLADVVEYCNWRSRREGLTPVYYVHGDRILRNKYADGYRIPTASEWDFAARGGRKNEPYVFAGSNDPQEVAWYGLSRYDGTRPVAQKAPNTLGLYDMSGNVREWTWPDDGIPVRGKEQEECAEVRGGGISSDVSGIALNSVCYLYVFTWNVTGFRLARNAE